MKKGFKVMTATKPDGAFSKFYTEPHKRFFFGIAIASLSLQAVLYCLSFAGIGNGIFHFLFLGNAKFDDLENGIVQSHLFFSPDIYTVSGYSQVASPPMLWIWDFYKIFVQTQNELYISLVFTWLFLFVLVYLSSQNLLITFMIMSCHPMLFLFSRGNPDIWVNMLTALAGIFLFRGNRWMTSIIFGFMGAVKFPYVLFCLIFFKRGQFKFVGLQLLVTILVFLAPLASRPWPWIGQIRVFNWIVGNYYSDYVIGDGGSLYNTSIYGSEKLLAYFAAGDSLSNFEVARKIAGYVVSIHVITLILISAIALYVYIRIREANFVIPSKKDSLKSEANRFEASFLLFLLLAIVVVLYPQISAEYRLAQIAIILGFVYRLNSAFLSDKINLVLITLILLPKHFLTYQISDLGIYITISSLATPIFLTILLIRLVIYLAKIPYLTKPSGWWLSEFLGVERFLISKPH